jgi:hypothetical protein
MSMQTLITFGIAILAALILAVWSFSGGRYGELRSSREAADAYASFQVDPEKNYYTSGPDFYPNALMGIDKSWTLASDLWERRELTPEAMKKIVVGMQSRFMERTTLLHGFDIVDDRGGKIGNWYSVMGLSIAVKVTGEQQVVITAPPIDTYPER